MFGVSFGRIAFVGFLFAFLALNVALGILLVAVVPLRLFLVLPLGVGPIYVRCFHVCILFPRGRHTATTLLN